MIKANHIRYIILDYPCYLHLTSRFHVLDLMLDNIRHYSSMDLALKDVEGTRREYESYIYINRNGDITDGREIDFTTINGVS